MYAVSYRLPDTVEVANMPVFGSVCVDRELNWRHVLQRTCLM